MKQKWIFTLAAITLLISSAMLGTLAVPRSIEAAKEPGPHIAIVNIAKVLREFEKAHDDGQKIAAKRKPAHLAAGTELLAVEMIDRTIVDVYQRIQSTIDEIARERGLDLVLVYPDASNMGDDGKPAIAQLKLQTPALMPFYVRKELDQTDDVIERLNKNHPPEKK